MLGRDPSSQDGFISSHLFLSLHAPVLPPSLPPPQSALPFFPSSIGDVVLVSHSYITAPWFLWVAVAAIVGFTLLYNLVATLALATLHRERWAMGERGERGRERQRGREKCGSEREGGRRGEGRTCSLLG